MKGFPQSHHRALVLRQRCENALKTHWDCLVYFNNGSCVKKTLLTYNLLEFSQFFGLSFNSGFPANLIFQINIMCEFGRG